MDKKKVYDVDDILRQTLFIPKTNRFIGNQKIIPGRDRKVVIDGEAINMASDRYKLFFDNRKCVKCGIEGQFMRMEKNTEDISYRFNMYGIDQFGHEVLITKDHIIPKSKGGKDRLSNYQTMCIRCNNEKGNK